MKAVRNRCRSRRRAPSGQGEFIARTIAWLIAGLLLGIILGGSCHRAAAAEGNSPFDSACRVTAPDGSRGTGCAFEISQGYVYVLTCGHVVGTAAAVSCEFWSQGHQSQALRGEVLRRVSEPAGDAAVVAVSTGQFGGRLPAAIPIAPHDFVIRPGDTLLSAGCANGSWSTAWKGHALATDGEELRFVPPPANGRSGSAILDADGRFIVGLLRARTIDSDQGIAVSVAGLYRQLGMAERMKDEGGRMKDQDCRERPLCRSGAPQRALPTVRLLTATAVPTQCPGGCCPNGTCPNCPSGNLSLGLGLRRERNANPWPTLPAAPAAPPMDVAPLAQGMGQIAQALGRLQPPPAAPAVPAGPDAATSAALQQLGAGLQRQDAEIARLRDDIPRAAQEAIKPMAEKLAAIDAAVKPLERIKERLDEDVQAGGLKGKLAQKIEKLAAGKPGESGDPAMRIILITLAAAAAVGLVVFLVIRQHQSAGSLSSLVTTAQTAVNGLAAKVPALAPAAAGLDAVGSLLQNQLNQLQQAQAAQTQSLHQVALATPAPAAVPTAVVQPAAPAPSASVQIATPVPGAGPQTAAAPPGAH